MTKAKAVAPLSAVERYRRHLAEQPVEIVKVGGVPSGFPFEFKRPSKLGMALKGTLPQSLAAQGAAAWNENGNASPHLSEADAVNAMYALRDKVLELSHNPKIVMGEANAPNELSTEDISDDDLEYLMFWVSAGGDEGVALANFRKRRAANAVAGSGGAGLRNESK